MATTETMEKPQTMPPPVKEHEWLQKFVGEWDIEGEMMEPGKPPQKWSGTESARSLGGCWVVSEGRSEDMMAGMGPSEVIFSYGYDPQKKKYVSTFIGSMMSYLWISEGTVDPTGKILTLDSMGPAMDMSGGTQPYRDVMEFKSDSERVLTSYYQDEGGEWKQMMTARYRRRK